MVLKIPSANGKGALAKVPASSSTELLKDFVNVMEFLSSLSGEGNSSREAGLLSLTTKDGKWQARLKDNSGKVYCYVTADRLDDVLLSVESGLGDGSLDWRRDTSPQFKNK